MKTIIFYFTGTGNSLAISKKLSKSILGEVKISHISEWKSSSFLQPTEDVIGIVFPIYFASIPKIVKDFVKNLM